MNYKTKVKDYTGLTLTPKYGYAYSQCRDYALDTIWKQIMRRYPKYSEKQWDEAYKAVETDLYENYEIEVTIKLKEKV